MSSLPSLWEPAPSRFWADNEAGRRSGNYAAALTLGLILAVNVSLVLWPSSSGVAVPLGDTPLAMEFRRVVKPSPPALEREAPKAETRKLLSAVAEPDRLVVPEPPKPDVKPEIRPEPKPRPKPVKPKPDKPRPVAEKTALVPSPAEARTDAVADMAPPGRTMGYASGQPEAKPDTTGAVLAALLHAVEANKHYPRQARRAGMEGKAVLRVSIGASGRVTACALVEGSGKTILDTATEKLGQALVGLEIPPARGITMNVLIPVRYALKR